MALQANHIQPGAHEPGWARIMPRHYHFPMPRTSLLLTGLLRLDDAIRVATAMWSGVREELAFLLTSEQEREAINSHINARDPLFPPTSDMYRAGLTEWENAAIRQAALPRGATILVGGAGAGREITALAANGFRAIGFDPNRSLVGQGQGPVRAAGGLLCEGSYDDVIELAELGTGRLRELMKGTHVDCVLMSWGSLSYVLGNDVRVRLLRAWRRLMPEAPLIVSFPTFPPPPAWQEGGITSRPSVLRWLWSRAPERWPQPGMRYLPRVGFAMAVDSDVLRELAGASGYVVDAVKLPQYAHALLRPPAAGDFQNR